MPLLQPWSWDRSEKHWEFPWNWNLKENEILGKGGNIYKGPTFGFHVNFHVFEKGGTWETTRNLWVFTAKFAPENWQLASKGNYCSLPSIIFFRGRKCEFQGVHTTVDSWSSRDCPDPAAFWEGDFFRGRAVKLRGVLNSYRYRYRCPPGN